MSEQRLSVTFGAFSCDVVGYDDPFSILNRVVEVFSEIARSNPAFGAGEVGMSDMERAKLAAGLSDQASRIEELSDNTAPSGVRYVVSNSETVEAPEATIEDPANTDEAVDEDVVIAAEADSDVISGDLELRDTLEAADAPAAIVEEEVVALAVDAAVAPEMPPIDVTEELDDAEAAVSENAISDQIETEERAAASSEDVTPEEPALDASVDIAPEMQVHAEPVLQAIAEDPSNVSDLADDMADVDLADLERAEADDLDIIDIAAFDEEPLDDEVLPDAVSEEAKVDAPDVEPAPLAARKPLRLNISHAGVEPSPADKSEADAEAPADEQPQQRVTIAKLPLRPEVKTSPEEIAAGFKHALTPVQKAEPVVTLNTTISSFEDDAPQPSRAERLKARMEQRNDEDDGENFLFADVDEALVDTPVQDIANEAPLTLGVPAPEAVEPEETSAPKPRRSIASLLGFGKKAAAEPDQSPEPAMEDQIPAAMSEIDYAGDTDGFDRLRQTVAAAMPVNEVAPAARPAPEPTPEADAPQSISEAIDFDDESSPTAFARSVGATTLQDLLEASAVYIDLVEGKSRFSRRDVMQALHQIDADSDYTQEARLKSFRKLLTTGSLVRVDDGMFTVSQATRYGYESQLQAS